MTPGSIRGTFSAGTTSLGRAKSFKSFIFRDDTIQTNSTQFELPGLFSLELGHIGKQYVDVYTESGFRTSYG